MIVFNYSFLNYIRIVIAGKIKASIVAISVHNECYTGTMLLKGSFREHCVGGMVVGGLLHAVGDCVWGSV